MKANKRKNFFFGISVLMLFSFQSYAQETQWIKIIVDNELEISINYVSCDNPILKIINNSSVSKTINWKEKIVNYLNETEQPLNNGNLKTLTIDANSVLIGDCNLSNSTLNVNPGNVVEPIGDGICTIEITDFLINP